MHRNRGAGLGGMNTLAASQERMRSTREVGSMEKDGPRWRKE